MATSRAPAPDPDQRGVQVHVLHLGNGEVTVNINQNGPAEGIGQSILMKTFKVVLKWFAKKLGVDGPASGHGQGQMAQIAGGEQHQDPANTGLVPAGRGHGHVDRVQTQQGVVMPPASVQGEAAGGEQHQDPANVGNP